MDEFGRGKVWIHGAEEYYRFRDAVDRQVKGLQNILESVPNEYVDRTLVMADFNIMKEIQKQLRHNSDFKELK